MTFLRKKIQLVSALLALLMSAVLFLPPSMDLELCLGTDGHIDFSLNRCHDGVSAKSQAEERTSVYDTAQHHGKCFDVAVACNSAQELIRAQVRTAADKFKPKKDPSKTPLFVQKSLADFAGGYLNSNVYSIPFEDFPSPHLVSLRTVVLLI